MLLYWATRLLIIIELLAPLGQTTQEASPPSPAKQGMDTAVEVLCTLRTLLSNLGSGKVRRAERKLGWLG